MTSSASSLGAGDVEIVLAGETRVLRPTFRALQSVSRMSGGGLAALRKVQDLDFDTIVATIALGLDLTPKGAEGLEEKVFASGIGFRDGLAGPVSRYIQVLLNGGRPVTEAAAGGDANPPAA